MTLLKVPTRNKQQHSLSSDEWKFALQKLKNIFVCVLSYFTLSTGVGYPKTNLPLHI
jgi:hypothetical protein